jgi:uncharacterized membrane-anchored protein YhcB (DUF1043 family)
MQLGFTAFELGVGGALFLGGLLIGLLARRTSRNVKARVRVLEAELAQATERLASYTDQVEKHFAQTSDLFGDLTRQYTAVWDHLAVGARELCPTMLLMHPPEEEAQAPPEPTEETNGEELGRPEPGSEDARTREQEGNG